MGKDTAPRGQGERIQGKNTLSSLVTRLMLCVQLLGESHCHLLQNYLTTKRIGQQKQQMAWTEKKGSRQSYTEAKSQHSPSAPRAACELLQCLGP